MSVIFGIESVNRTVGWAIDLCSDCGGLARVEIGEQRRCPHVYFVPLGSGRVVRLQQKCLRCGATRARRPEAHRPDPEPPGQRPPHLAHHTGASGGGEADVDAAAAIVRTNPRLADFLSIGRLIAIDRRRSLLAAGVTAPISTADAMRTRGDGEMPSGSRDHEGAVVEGSNDGIDAGLSLQRSGGKAQPTVAGRRSRPGRSRGHVFPLSERDTEHVAPAHASSATFWSGRRARRGRRFDAEPVAPEVAVAQARTWFASAIERLGPHIAPRVETSGLNPKEADALLARAGRAERALRALVPVYLADGAEDWVLPPLVHWPLLSHDEQAYAALDAEAAAAEFTRVQRAASLLGRLGHTFQMWQTVVLTALFALPVIALIVREMLLGVGRWSTTVLVGSLMLLIFVALSMHRQEIRRWFGHRLIPAADDAGIPPLDIAAVMTRLDPSTSWCDSRFRTMLRSVPHLLEALELLGRLPRGRDFGSTAESGGATPATELTAERRGRRQWGRTPSGRGATAVRGDWNTYDELVHQNPFARYDETSLVRLMRLPPPD